MKKFVLWLTLTALLAAVSPAAGQIVKPWEKKTWDAKKRDFILATLEDSELSALRKPSERQREEYRRDVWKNAALLFDPYGTEPSPRRYDEDERIDLGDKGRFSKAQIGALRTFVAPFLEFPRRPLTDSEKNVVADAFSIDQNLLELSARAFEAYLADAFGEDPVRSSSYLAGEKLTDNLLSVSYDELETKLATLLEKRSALALLDEIQTRPRFEQAIVLDCLLERCDDRLDDYEYAQALNDSVNLFLSLRTGATNRYQDAEQRSTGLEIVEERLAKATTTRPHSWAVATVVAATIWRKLPKTFVIDPTPSRIFDDVPDAPQGTVVSACERDRVVVLQTLARALPDAIDSGGAPTPGKRDERPRLNPAVPPKFPNVVDYRWYFKIFSEALRYDRFGGSEVDLDQKTDLSNLPPLRVETESDAKSASKKHASSDKRYEFPVSFEGAPCDGERYAYVKILERTALKFDPSEDRRAVFLSQLGAATQLRLGIQIPIARARAARKLLESLAKSGGAPDANAKILEEIAKIDQFLADVPTLSDDETFAYMENFTGVALPKNADPLRAQSLAPERITFSETNNFIAFLKRSIELEENGEALALLATEYQAREDDSRALELWKRAKEAKFFSTPQMAENVGLQRFAGVPSRAQIEKRIDSKIVELEKKLNSSPSTAKP